MILKANCKYCHNEFEYERNEGAKGRPREFCSIQHKRREKYRVKQRKAAEAIIRAQESVGIKPRVTL